MHRPHLQPWPTAPSAPPTRLPQVADVLKVMVQKVFYRFEVVKVGSGRSFCTAVPVAALAVPCTGLLAVPCNARRCQQPHQALGCVFAARGPNHILLPGLLQEHCHQTGEQPPAWVRWIDAPGTWCEHMSEKLEDAFTVRRVHGCAGSRPARRRPTSGCHLLYTDLRCRVHSWARRC